MRTLIPTAVSQGPGDKARRSRLEENADCRAPEPSRPAVLSRPALTFCSYTHSLPQPHPLRVPY